MGNSNISSCCDGISKEKEQKEEINLSDTNRIRGDSIKTVNKMKGQMTMKPKKNKYSELIHLIILMWDKYLMFGMIGLISK